MQGLEKILEEIGELRGQAGSECTSEDHYIKKAWEHCLDRVVGTVEECREAVEKQKPKIPDYEGDGYADGYMVYDTWICPNCGTKYEIDNDEYEHCPKCGQAIQWENEYMGGIV